LQHPIILPVDLFHPTQFQLLRIRILDATRECITERDAWFSNLGKLRGERNEHLDNLVRASADSLARRSNRVSRGGWANPPVARVRSNLADSTFCDGYADRVNKSEPWTGIAPVTMSRDGRFLAEFQYFGKWLCGTREGERESLAMIH
jgi:hypothetical protein